MTNEEALSILHCPDTVGGLYSKKYGEALNMAMEALKKESCEDCISRQAVDILVDELARVISDERCYISRGRSTTTIMQDILDLPSVTPQPKTGHREYNDIYDHYLCGNCKTVVMDYDNFCPNCGADMRGDINAYSD